jgi:hypothetical protein
MVEKKTMTRFPLRDAWIRISPFKSRQSVLQTEKKYMSGKSIGFTALASLRSMGRLPRSDGTYRVGDKYKTVSYP